MSEVPQPKSRSPSRRLGTLSAMGTVSRCPASRTLWARPRSVRARTLLPSRMTVRCGRAASASWTRSASRCSSPLTLSTSTSAAVRATTSAARSRPMTTILPALPRLDPMTTASGWGLATLTSDDQVLDTWYPAPQLAEGAAAPEGLEKLAGVDEVRGVRREGGGRVIDLGAPPADAPDAYLRLHLLSHRLIQPHGCDLTGLFGVLTNVVWTPAGPCAAAGFEATRLQLLADRGAVQVLGVDTFPRMVDYVIPTGVRIADADRVRLGAHLAPGTTVMHEGFVNYNAGTLGTSMVEGRISAGVVVDDGSDIGGGASVMGTLSGGGTEVIRIGKRCLLGANAGTGISLGDDCVVGAGCYVPAGTKVTLEDGRVVKGRDLSGSAGLLYLRDSVTGAIQARARAGKTGELNAALQAN